MSMLVSSRKNPAVTAYRELNSDRKCRERERKFNTEGVRLCEEVIRAGLTVTAAFLTESAEAKYPGICGLIRERIEPVTITDELGAYISDTKSPQGVFLTAEIPDSRLVTDSTECRLLILDGVQDPGNVGTMIRTCEALGTDGMILSPDCADIWSPKVVRSTMGSLFRLPMTTASLPETIKKLRTEGFTVYAAVPDKTAKSIRETEFPAKCAVIIGNEGNGVSPEVINSADGNIYIPIRNAESLNASIAAAIFCYEMKG